MLNLLGRARKGSTFSPSEGGGYKLPPTRNTEAPSAPRGKAPARPYRGDGYERYKERERKKYRAKELRELERRFRSYQKTIEEIQKFADDNREPLELATDFTPMGNLKDVVMMWEKVIPAQAEGYVWPAGWTLMCDNAFGVGPIMQGNHSGWVHKLCNLGGQVPNGYRPQPIVGNVWSISFGAGYNVVGGRHTRFSLSKVYNRSSLSVPPPTWKDAIPASRQSYLLPPEPVLPNRAPKADLTPAIGKVPNPLPYQRPALVMEPRPDGRMKMRRGYHNSLRPGRKKKEFKMRMSNVLAPLIGAVTESVEWIDMLHDNLPNHLQAKGDYDRFGNYKGKGKGDPTPQEKAKAVYANINAIDPRGLVMDIVKNHYEDKFFGKLGEAGGKLARDNKWLIGPQAGFGL